MPSDRIDPLNDSDPGPMTDEEWEPFARATGIEPPNDSLADSLREEARVARVYAWESSGTPTTDTLAGWADLMDRAAEALTDDRT